MMPDLMDEKRLHGKLAKFDYDTPVEEWDEEEIQELLDLVAHTDTGMGEALRKGRGLNEDL